ncbi:hypothetical protein AB0B31_33100 [Catellatospora citrea]|uniref:hypothetical protein n=1 Tax=Catellatospora citrea TaxID=53366 RepID=UPI0033CB7AED
MEMPAAFVSAVDSVAYEFASARPNAPVVPHVERPRRIRAVRAGLARGLTRAAGLIKTA